jgi:hypothetical protein
MFKRAHGSPRPCVAFRKAGVLRPAVDLRIQYIRSYTPYLVAQSVERLGHGVHLPVGVRAFSLLHSLQTGSAAHPASHPMDAVRSTAGGKVAGT